MTLNAAGDRKVPVTIKLNTYSKLSSQGFTNVESYITHLESTIFKLSATNKAIERAAHEAHAELERYKAAYPPPPSTPTPTPEAQA